MLTTLAQSPLLMAQTVNRTDGIVTAGGLTVDQTNGASNRSGGIFLSRGGDNRASIESDYFNGLIFSNKSGAVSKGHLQKKMRITTAGDLSLTGGGGIIFGSAGGTGTSTSNLLDEYEEGTWVPNIQPTTGSITWLSSADTLSYIKVGSAVHIFGRLEVSSVSSPSGITRGSVPSLWQL
jgi:hypothetical protein